MPIERVLGDWPPLTSIASAITEVLRLSIREESMKKEETESGVFEVWKVKLARRRLRKNEENW